MDFGRIHFVKAGISSKLHCHENDAWGLGSVGEEWWHVGAPFAGQG